MQERVRIAVIFAVVAIVVGGGSYYFFAIYRPNQVKKNAQDEVVAWEERWHHARACLLGEHPVSARASESLAIRELSPDPWDRGTCTGAIGKLMRGEAPDSGLPAVEAAWEAIDASATHFAKAFAAHIDPGGEKPAQRLVDPLPKALDEIEQADVALRKAAGMDPPPAPEAAMPALPRLATAPLAYSGKPLPAIDRWSMASAHGAFALAALDHQQLQIVFAAGAAPSITPVAELERRAVPDGSWAMNGGENKLEVDKTQQKLDGFGTPLFALGPADDGIGAYAVDAKVGLVHIAKGKATIDKPFETARSAFGLDPSGKAALVWSTPDGALHGMLVHPGAAPRPVELGSGDPDVVCLTGDRAWIAAGEQYISFDDTGGTPHVLPHENLVGCNATAALLEKTTQRYAVCTTSCREVDLSAARYNVIATLAGEKVVAVATRGNVLALWQENAAPTFFATDAPIDPRYMLSDGNVVDLIGAADVGVVTARIPLK